MNNPDPRFSIRKSTLRGAGEGLFACRPIAKGKMFWVPGALVRRHSFADRCTRYADAYKFRVGAHVLIPSGDASMVNHSRSPNLEKVISGNKLFLRSLRMIKIDEELFFRYSRYAQKRFVSES